MKFTITEARKSVSDKLSRYFGADFKTATNDQIYKALAMCVRDMLLLQKQELHKKILAQKAKRVYYMCMEFLLGKSLKNNLCNMGIEGVARKTLKAEGFDLDALYEIEADAALGNGGLGRLAACFMDSLATLHYPAIGFTLRYEYGLFKQRIVEGSQAELPDIWLDSGEAWMVPRSDKTFTVKFDGRLKESWEEGGLKVEHVDATVFEAVPYDMMISGAGGEAVSILRLWRARTLMPFNMTFLSQGDYSQAVKAEGEADLITKALYPSDDHYAGKTLRIVQQYFLVSASVQNIVRDHMRSYNTIENLPDKVAIHINDTHPALCVPELMRILLDEHGFSWEKAWDFTVRIISYTNHTVMAEALEKWGEELISSKLPRIYSIIKEINNRFLKETWDKYHDVGKQESVAVIAKSQVRMANLAVIGSHSVNGVSALHSDIIKKSVFADFYRMAPYKFTNVTNGIAHRRWLSQCNPRLDRLIQNLIGDGYMKDAAELENLLGYKDDAKALGELAGIKLENKKDFADYIKRKQDFTVNPYARFDTQIKRMHEYKRQLLNALKIITLYLELKDNPNKDVAPQCFIFGGKAAPGYRHAKRVISLINALSVQIQQSRKIKEKLDVLFLENYNVTAAERLIPASEVSQQISLAGKEASGTSNMKFMLNGAVTLGTLDGANVEIYESVGKDNMFLFGLTEDKVADLWKKGYFATSYYSGSERIKMAVEALKTGFGGESFADIAQYLVSNSLMSDPYMCLADYGDYMRAHKEMCVKYADADTWNKMSLVNIARAGRFAADRSVKEYAQNIWGLKPIV